MDLVGEMKAIEMYACSCNVRTWQPKVTCLMHDASIFVTNIFVAHRKSGGTALVTLLKRNDDKPCDFQGYRKVLTWMIIDEVKEGIV